MRTGASLRATGDASRRSASDATTLLVELGRLVRGRRHYRPDDERITLLFDRALRSLQADLGRNGALEVKLEGQGLRVEGLGLRLASTQLGGLPELLREHNVLVLRFEPELESGGLAILVDLLVDVPVSQDPTEVARTFYERGARAIDLNGVVRPRAGAATSHATTLVLETDRRVEAPARSAQPETAVDAPRETAGREAPLLEPARDPVPAPELEPEPEPEAPVVASAGERPTVPEVPGTAPTPAPPVELRLPEPEPEPAPAAPEWPEAPAPETAGAGLARGLRGTRPDEPERSEEIDEARAPLDPGPERLLRPEDAQPEAEDPHELFDYRAERALAADTEDAPDSPDAAEAPPALDYSLSDSDWSLETDDRTDPLRSDETTDAEPPRRPRAPREASDTTPVIEDTDTEVVAAAQRAAAQDASAHEDSRRVQFLHLLRDLDECDDDEDYNQLARRMLSLAEALSQEGMQAVGQAGLELFARHASGESKRSPRQQSIAEEHLERLARGAPLIHLMDRASSEEDADESIRCSQILLQLGGPVVPDLFQAAEHESDPNRRGQLQGILIAMGDQALPELLRVMDLEDRGWVRSAIRLAGETQNPGAVERVTRFVSGTDPAVRQEAAKALVRIGSPEAIDALVRALRSPVPDVPSLAAYCLGASGSRKAAEALVLLLRDVVEAHDFALANEIVRALGRLGRTEATPELAGILLRRSLRKRRAFRELKLAVAQALSRIPGDDAVGALAQAARSRDTQLRQAAQTSLDRRSHALS